MKTRVMWLMATVCLLLSGCVVYDEPYRDGGMHRGEREHDRGRDHDQGRFRDSDRDGVPNRQDRRPYDRDRN